LAVIQERIMASTFTGMHAGLSREPSAVQNPHIPGSKIKLVLLWLAVALPLLWGAIKAVENIGSLPL
jgi:hypothetical protein